MEHRAERATWQRRRCGYDAWNPDAVASQAFRNPDVVAVEWGPVLTGLWADVRLTFADGRREAARFYF